MVGKRIRVVGTLLATLAATAALVVTAAPASAAAGSGAATGIDPRLCETFGQHFCVGSDDTNPFTPVVERIPGRNLILTDLKSKFQNKELFLIRFSSDTPECIAAANDNVDVTINACTGSIGVEWAMDTEVDSSGIAHDIWENRAATLARGNNVYLSGHNDGTAFQLQRLGVAGAFQKFDERPNT